MELLDRYLRAVKPLLPKEQQEDILAELSEEIEAQMDERQRTLGRPLTDAEQEEILNRFGHPLLVGGRYQENTGTVSFGRELIGKELFPFYVKAMTITFAIAVAAHVLILAAVSYWEPVSVGDWISGFVFHFSVQFAILTGIFASIQGHLNRNPNKWDALDGSATPAAKNPHTAVRFEAITELVVLAVILAGIHAVLWPQHVSLAIGELAPVWHAAYWPIASLTVATMLYDLVLIFRPEYVSYRPVSRILGPLVWLGTCGYILNAGLWVVKSPSVPDTAQIRQAIVGINEYLFRYGLISTMAVLAVVTIWEIFSTARRRRAGQRSL